MPRTVGDAPAGGLTAIRNLPLAVEVARAHLARNPWQAVWVGARLLPRELLSRAAVAGRQGPGAVVAAAASGQRELARTILTTELASAPPRRHRRLLAAAAATGEGSTAQAAARRYAGSAPAAAAVGNAAAYVSYAAGEVREAQTALRQHRSPLARGHRRWLQGQRSVLAGDALLGLGEVRPPTRVVRASGDVTVLHAVTNALPDVQAGYTIRTHGLVAAQRAAGLEAHVSTPPGFPVTRGHLRARADELVDGVPYHRDLGRGAGLGRPDAHLEAYAVSLGSRARDLRADVLHAHSGHINAQAALVAGARLGLPVVYEVRGFLEETWRARGGDRTTDFYRWSRETETRCMLAAQTVVTLSESMRSQIVGRGVDPANVHVIGNCVPEPTLFDPVDRSAARAALGIADDAFVVGSVSTVNGYEGLDLLVEAAALTDDPELVLVVAGDGPAHDGLVRRARELVAAGVRTTVVLPGRVPHAQARDVQSALDVFCVPRRRTAVTSLVPPLKPVEAMALGIPVVASDLPPLRELVRHERGLLVPPDDVAALAAAITTLMSDRPRRDRLGAEARRHVAAQRTWSVAADRYREVYDAALGSSPSSSLLRCQEAS